MSLSWGAHTPSPGFQSMWAPAGLDDVMCRGEGEETPPSFCPCKGHFAGKWPGRTSMEIGAQSPVLGPDRRSRYLRAWSAAPGITTLCQYIRIFQTHPPYMRMAAEPGLASLPDWVELQAKELTTATLGTSRACGPGEGCGSGSFYTSRPLWLAVLSCINAAGFPAGL